MELNPTDPEGQFDVNESGEGTQLAPGPAILYAIYDAIGVRFKSLPVILEKVLETLYEKEKK